MPIPTISGNALRTHRTLLRFALAGAHLYAWVFVFQYFFLTSADIAAALARTILLYALSQSVTCLATPLAARLLRYGVRRAVLYGVIALSAAFVMLGATFSGSLGPSLDLGILSFAILLGFYRATYWMPYEVESLAAGGKRPMHSGAEFFVGAAPVAAGLFIVIDPAAPAWLLFAGAALIAASALPLSGVPETHEGFAWGYRETFMHLMARENRGYVSRAVLEGVSGAALLLLWPIAVFLITGWSYGLLGVILSFTFFISIVARRPVRALLLRTRFHQAKWFNGMLAATPWLLRLVVATPFSIVLVDSYSYTSSPRRQGIDPLVFEQVSDGGTYVDEYTALKEMGLTIGRLTTSAVAAFLALLVSLPVAFAGAFVLAALASAALVVSKQ